MKLSRSNSLVILIVAVVAGFALTGCESQYEALVSVTVSPAAATATHGSANDTVQFTAGGNFGKFGSYQNSTATATCLLHASDITRPLTAVTWTTSDPMNTSIDEKGVAVCTGTTAAPATISALASGICGGVKGTAILNCD